MITSPYGLKKVSYWAIPITVQDFADSLYCYWEDDMFHQDSYLVPGMKTVNDNFSFFNNIRGEKIEVIGAVEELKSVSDVKNVALIMPCSHTQVIYVRGMRL